MFKKIRKEFRDWDMLIGEKENLMNCFSWFQSLILNHNLTFFVLKDLKKSIRVVSDLTTLRVAHHSSSTIGSGRGAPWNGYRQTAECLFHSIICS